MAISNVTEYAGQLPQEGDQATFSDRSAALFAWLVQGAMPEFNVSVTELNAALNGEASTLAALQAVQDALAAIPSNNEFTNAQQTKLNALNEAIASQAEAEAGLDNSKRMTALRVKNALDAAPGGSGAPVAVIEDQKGGSTNGGTGITGTWITRNLNTIVRNIDSAVSLSSDKFTVLNDGWCRFETPGYDCNRLQARLYNVTDGVVVAYGRQLHLSSSDQVYGVSVGGGPVLAGKQYRLDSFLQNGGGNTLGISAYDTGGPSIYSRAEIFQ